VSDSPPAVFVLLNRTDEDGEQEVVICRGVQSIQTGDHGVRCCPARWSGTDEWRDLFIPWPAIQAINYGEVMVD